MRIKCKHCGKIEELSNEQREKYALIVREDDLKIEDYLNILSNARGKQGKCSENKRHEFIVEESFKNDVDQVIGLYKNNVSSKDADTRSLEEATKTVQELEKMILDTKEKIVGLETNIKSSDENIEHAKRTIPKMTGANIGTWL